MTSRRAVVAFAVLASAAACARVERLVDASPKPTPADDTWAAQCERWTRESTLYDGLAMRALASAVYQAPELRRARAERMATWKALTTAERDALLAQEEADLAKYDEFILWMMTGDPDDNDLDVRTTAWRLALVSPGKPDVVGPEVSEVRADSLVRTLYPGIDDFDIVYRVRFPRLPGRETWTEPFALVVAGPRGRLEFPFGTTPRDDPGQGGAPAVTE